MTENDKQELERISVNIEKFGCQVMHVFEDEEHPPFSYTIGLYEKYNHPEIIIIGLKRELTQVLLDNMAYEIERERTFTNGEYHEGVLDNFACYFGEVPKKHYKEYVGRAIFFYDSLEFPLTQCVPPNVGGKFPWDKDFPEDAKFYLKVITNPPKEH